jgi:hypothetical protein
MVKMSAGDQLAGDVPADSTEQQISPERVPQNFRNAHTGLVLDVVGGGRTS